MKILVYNDAVSLLVIYHCVCPGELVIQPSHLSPLM